MIDLVSKSQVLMSNFVSDTKKKKIGFLPLKGVKGEFPIFLPLKICILQREFVEVHRSC